MDDIDAAISRVFTRGLGEPMRRQQVGLRILVDSRFRPTENAPCFSHLQCQTLKRMLGSVV